MRARQEVRRSSGCAVSAKSVRARVAFHIARPSLGAFPKIGAFAFQECQALKLTVVSAAKMESPSLSTSKTEGLHSIIVKVSSEKGCGQHLQRSNQAQNSKSYPLEPFFWQMALDLGNYQFSSRIAMMTGCRRAVPAPCSSEEMPKYVSCLNETLP